MYLLARSSFRFGHNRQARSVHRCRGNGYLCPARMETRESGRAGNASTPSGWTGASVCGGKGASGSSGNCQQKQEGRVHGWRSCSGTDGASSKRYITGQFTAPSPSTTRDALIGHAVLVGGVGGCGIVHRYIPSLGSIARTKNQPNQSRMNFVDKNLGSEV